MKHLKIYFAVLFFSFLGSFNSELMAQSNTAKYGEKLTTLRSDNKAYQLIVSYTPYGYNDMPKAVITFQLVKVDYSHTIWEGKFDVPHTVDYIIMGEGRIMTKGNDEQNPSYVIIGGDNGQGKGTFLRLHNDGELAIYGGSWKGDGDKVWSSGTCGGVLGGCGAVGSR